MVTLQSLDFLQAISVLNNFFKYLRLLNFFGLITIHSFAEAISTPNHTGHCMQVFVNMLHQYTSDTSSLSANQLCITANQGG